MRLASYWTAAGWRAGILLDDVVVDALTAARQARLVGADGGSAWTRVKAVLQAQPREHAQLVAAVQELAGTASPGVMALAQVRLGPPIPDPDKIVCVGLNYRDHAAEANLPLPSVPMLFAKFRNALVGPTDAIVAPPITQAIDYEAELAVVIGRRAKDVPVAQALDYLAGAMAFNDVSARDLQTQTSQWMAGKALDTFAPCGPALVLKDELGDLQDLLVEARVNGQLVQQASTADMIFSVAELVSFISRIMTLEPGDIIATGTPAGVGFKRTPPLLLRDGDLVEVSVGGLGTLSNPVVAARVAA